MTTAPRKRTEDSRSYHSFAKARVGPFKVGGGGVGCIGRTAIWRESAGVEPGGVTQARKDDWTVTDAQPTSLTLVALRWPLFRHTGEGPGLSTFALESAGPELRSPQGILLEQSCTCCENVCVCVCVHPHLKKKKKKETKSMRQNLKIRRSHITSKLFLGVLLLLFYESESLSRGLSFLVTGP